MQALQAYYVITVVHDDCYFYLPLLHAPIEFLFFFRLPCQCDLGHS